MAGDLVSQFRAARRDRALAVLEGFHAVKHAVRFGAELARVVTDDVAEVALYASRLAPDVEEPLLALCEEAPEEVFADRFLPPAADRALRAARG